MSFLRSELLYSAGFRHAFSTRRGGVSQGAFASLNLGRGLGDDDASVSENHRRLAELVGYGADALHEIEQVHGARCLTLDARLSPDHTRVMQADALVAPAREGVVGVRTADCLPLLLACPGSGSVAAVHVGWRGAVSGVVAAAVRALLAPDASDRERVEGAGDLLAAIGPHIRVGAFEVGEDVAARIQAAAPGHPVIEARGARRYADLARVVSAQLADLGLSAARVDDVGGCTFSEPERFFSYRRDDGRTGRQLALIGARA